LNYCEMKIKTLICLLIMFASRTVNLFAGPDTIYVDTKLDTDRIALDLDSLVGNWYAGLALANNPVVVGDTFDIEYPDSLYSARLQSINSVINLPYNRIIKNHIHVYTIKQRDKFSVVLGLKDYYFPMIEDVFESYGLPTELKYMAVIESALNPNAVSRVGATGMWQFMNSTGKAYGLTINSIIDERRDPVKATHAAARYLKDLYKIYNDWILVIAAYNCGPGNVNKAIRRSGNQKDYWDIYYRLPRETRGYIPQFVAAAYATTFYAEHKIAPTPISFPIATDTIMLHKDIHLGQISEVMGIPYGEIKALNPEYRTGLVPATSKSMAITLPISYLGDFIDLADSIRNYKPELISKNMDVDPTRSSSVPVSVPGKTKLVYTVKEGDNLGYIAEWFNVGLSDLRYWNDIYGNIIRIGQKINVFVDPNKTDFYSRINEMTFAQKQATKGIAVPNNVQQAQVAEEIVEGDYIIHVVRNGDTIWDIVKMYAGATTTEVLALNNISDPQKIQVGQRLKIMRKS
jgi:membrane-bound lytic murein transglycosylase D